MTLVSIGDRVEEGIYRFHSRFNRAANFVRDGRLVSVVDEGIGDGPLNIVLQKMTTPARCRRDPLEVRAGRVMFEGETLRFSDRHRYCSALPRGTRAAPRFVRNLAAFGDALRARAHPQSLAFLVDARRMRHFHPGFQRAFAEHVVRCVEQIFRGPRLQGIRGLRGCGTGLTPSGDDFIAGHLIALNLLDRIRGSDHRAAVMAARRAARSRNPFSDTFLELAAQGLIFGRMRGLIHALLHEGRAAVDRATAQLLAIGGTSGADLGTGFFMTMTNGMGAA